MSVCSKDIHARRGEGIPTHVFVRGTVSHILCAAMMRPHTHTHTQPVTLSSSQSDLISDSADSQPPGQLSLAGSLTLPPPPTPHPARRPACLPATKQKKRPAAPPGGIPGLHSRARTFRPTCLRPQGPLLVTAHETEVAAQSPAAAEPGTCPLPVRGPYSCVSPPPLEVSLRAV